MDVSALGADVASARWIGPIEVEERSGGGVQLRLFFPKRIMAANQALQLASMHFDSDGFGFEQTHKYFAW